MKKIIFGIILSILLWGLNDELRAQSSELSYNRAGIVELIYLDLKCDADPSIKYNERINLWMRNDGKVADNYQGPLLYNNGCVNFATLHDKLGALISQRKTWGGSYFVKVKLSMDLPISGTYHLKAFFPVTQTNAITRSILLYDKANPGAGPVNILNGDYVFSVTSSATKVNDRFYIEVYAGEVLTTGTNLLWNNGTSWISGKVPADKSMHVVIPQDCSVKINTGENFLIGRLSDYGAVENNGTLTVQEGVEVDPTQQ